MKTMNENYATRYYASLYLVKNKIELYSYMQPNYQIEEKLF